MNFKKTYTEANNQIHGDRSKIDTIFEIAEKKRNPHSVYQICTAACAAAVIIGVYINGFAPGKITEPKSSIAGAKQTVTEFAKGNAAGSAEKNIAEKKADVAIADTKPTDQKSPEASAEKQPDKPSLAYSAPQSESKSLPKTDSDLPEDIGADGESAQISAFSDMGSDASRKGIADENGRSKEASHSGANYAAVAQVSGDYLDEAAYAEYLGVDVAQKAKLPNDMKFDGFYGTFVSKDSESGKATYDTAFYSAYTSDREYSRHIDIYTSKLEYADTPGDGGAERRQTEKFSTDGVYYTVCAYGTDDLEFDTLIKSLKQ